MDMFTFAHAFGKRYDLPIPLALFVFGGAGVVIVSFLLVMHRQVDHSGAEETAGDSMQLPRFSWPWAAVSFVLFTLFVITGIFGSQTVPENIVPTLFWLVIWIAVPLSCGSIGDYTRRLNPMSHIARVTNSDKLRQLILGRSHPSHWPERLGWWPAVILYFVLACGELIYNATATIPALTATFLVTDFVLSAFMGLLYGDDWLQRGEIFSVLYATWGKLGWFRFGDPGKRGFAGGLHGRPFEHTASRIAFVMLLLVSVGFDGLLSTPLWSNIEHRLPSAMSLGTSGYLLFATVFFAASAMSFIALFYGFAAAVAWAGSYVNSRPRDVLAGLLSSLLPISFGYLLAHNIEYLLVNGQLLFPLIGNPTGLSSWPLHLPFPFNDSFEPYPHFLPSWFYWYLSVGLIIVVHIIAVVLAHRHLSGAARNVVQARRSEYPWVVAMVAYTMLSLWLLAQPLIKEQSSSSTAKTAWHVSSQTIQLVANSTSNSELPKP